jgi:hypothetical protein
MNLREGTRRLALLLGVVGAIAGGYGSMLVLIDVHGRATPSSAWEYLCISLLPILGFFIPWGAARAIGWTLEGFIHPLS